MTLDDLQGDIREYYARVEAVLTGMDRLLAKLQDRVAALERKQGTGHAPASASSEERLELLEGQLAAIAAALGEAEESDSPRILLGG